MDFLRLRLGFTLQQTASAPVFAHNQRFVEASSSRFSFTMECDWQGHSVPNHLLLPVACFIYTTYLPEAAFVKKLKREVMAPCHDTATNLQPHSVHG
jgi:hypothetical protein